jgi:flagellar biogenesis protein FliO
MLKVRYQKDVGGDFVSVAPRKRMKVIRVDDRVSVVGELVSQE